jgi:hypothetical protein
VAFYREFMRPYGFPLLLLLSFPPSLASQTAADTAAILTQLKPDLDGDRAPQGARGHIPRVEVPIGLESLRAPFVEHLGPLCFSGPPEANRWTIAELVLTQFRIAGDSAYVGLETIARGRDFGGASGIGLLRTLVRSDADTTSWVSIHTQGILWDGWANDSLAPVKECIG